MKAFAFILYVMNPAGDVSSFVIDYDLSRDDCAALHEQWAPTLDQHSTVFCMES